MTALKSAGKALESPRRYDKTGMPGKLLEDENHAVRNSPCHSVDDTGRGLKALDGNHISVNPQATVEGGGSAASERNHVPLAEDASKTIEFLRARLLSERAASRAARQQAQEIARKVSELQSRLELEMEQRKKAEVAAEEIFAVLKSKGLATENIPYASRTLQARKSRSEEGILPPHDSKESVGSEQESSEDVRHTISRLGADCLDMSMLVRHTESSEGITQNVQIANNFVGKVDTQYNVEELVQPCKEADKDCNLDSKDNGLEVGDTMIRDLIENKQEIGSEHCEKLKVSQTNEPAGERHAIPKKLNAMLHNVEEEEEADNLSDEQPLKLNMQGWVDNMVNVLEQKDPRLKPGFHLVDLEKLLHPDGSPSMLQGPAECDNASSNRSSSLYMQVGRNMTLSESERLNHVEWLVKLLGKVNVDVLRLAESELPLANQLQEVKKKPDSTDAILSPIKMAKHSNSSRNNTKDDGLQQNEKNLTENVEVSKIRGPVRSAHGRLHPWVSPPNVNLLSNETKTHHRSHASSDSLKEIYMEGADFGMGSLGGLVTLKENSHVPIYPEVLGMPQVVHAHMDYAGAEWVHQTEAASSRQSDDSLTGETRPVPGQWRVYESLPQATISNSEKQAGLGTREIHPQTFFINDVVHDNTGQNIDFHTNPEMFPAGAALVGHRNLEFKMRPKNSQGRVQPLLSPLLGEEFEFNFQKPKHTRAHALMDDRNGRLGDVLKALHLAKEQVKDEEFSASYFEDGFGPTVSSAGKLEPSIDDHGDEQWQVPYGDHPWRSDVLGQTSIVHCPTSPSSDHGFSALERHDGLRRSNSVSTNFMMPAYLQPRGKVHLGNGITLYTD